MKRKKMNYKKSRRDFVRKSAVHPRNMMPAGTTMTQRGGIRL